MAKPLFLTGWLSRQVAAQSGYAVYTTPTGGLAGVTEAAAGEEPIFKHDDLVCQGPICEFRERVPPFDPRLFEGWPQVQTEAKKHVNISLEDLRARLREERRQGRGCEGCDGPGTYTCTHCKKARYCSEDCYRDDWNIHKMHCRANPSL